MIWKRKLLRVSCRGRLWSGGITNTGSRSLSFCIEAKSRMASNQVEIVVDSGQAFPKKPRQDKWLEMEMEEWIMPLTHGVGHNYNWTLCVCVVCSTKCVDLTMEAHCMDVCGGTTTLYCTFTLCVRLCVYAIFSLYFVCERLSEALREHRGWSLPVPCLTGHSVDRMHAHTHTHTISDHLPFSFSLSHASMCQADVESARAGAAGPWASFPFAFVPVPITPPPLALPQSIVGGQGRLTFPNNKHSARSLQRGPTQLTALAGNLPVWVVKCRRIIIMLCRVMFHKAAKCRGVWYPVHLVL